MLKAKLEKLQTILDECIDLLRQSPSTREATPKLLEKLGTALGCQWGTFWQVDPIARVLWPVDTWNSMSIKADKLQEDTSHRNLSLSEGNAGHVWRSHKPLWTTDLVKDMCIPRSLDADSIGLRGGVWFALKTDLAVYGVIELLGLNLSPAEDELIAGIEIFGIQLGKILEQRLKKE